MTARRHSRSRAARESRRAQQFARFRLTELNLVPLVDTFVSIVFFALTAAAVGELIPVARGVTLPTSRVGEIALAQLTLGVGPGGATLGGQRVATADELAAGSAVPALERALRGAADSIRTERGLAAAAPVPVPLAVQGDRAIRYAQLARVMDAARRAGFAELTLQVTRVGGGGAP
jgi:biopolymer transport protein ExbD